MQFFFCSPGGLLFDAQTAKLLGSSPPQTRTLTYPLSESDTGTRQDSSQDIWTSFDLSWKELYSEGIITKVNKTYNNKLILNFTLLPCNGNKFRYCIEHNLLTLNQSVRGFSPVNSV